MFHSLYPLNLVIPLSMIHCVYKLHFVDLGVEKFFRFFLSFVISDIFENDTLVTV